MKLRKKRAHCYTGLERGLFGHLLKIILKWKQGNQNLVYTGDNKCF